MRSARKRGFALLVALATLLIACAGSQTPEAAPEAAASTSAIADGSPATAEIEAEADEEPPPGEAEEQRADAATATTPSPSGDTAISSIDWWGCWRALDAVDANGTTPSEGAKVDTVPNCAAGPRSVGSAGDLSHPSNPPTFRPTGAGGAPAIEFTFEGDTLLQTDGGRPLSGDQVLRGSTAGISVAWVGMMADVNSHDIKWLVSGLSDDHEYPMLMVEGEGLNRFAGYGGGGVEARSSDRVIEDGAIRGVILYLAGDGGSSTIEVDGLDLRTGLDAPMRTDVVGITLGNIHFGNFSTTDHQFVFLGLHEGPLSEGDRAAFWAYVDEQR